MAEPLTKKIRVWNPAIDDMRKEELPTSKETSPQPIDFSQNGKPTGQLPIFFQNYMHLAMMRMQQQQQMEQAMRQRFLSGMVQSRAQTMIPPPVVEQPPPVAAQVTNGNTPTMNPLVASALGVQPLSENCCAVCGAHFRLTGDLVTHMRNNHRRTRFKRKNEKPVD